VNLTGYTGNRERCGCPWTVPNQHLCAYRRPVLQQPGPPGNPSQFTLMASVATAARPPKRSQRRRFRTGRSPARRDGCQDPLRRTPSAEARSRRVCALDSREFDFEGIGDPRHQRIIGSIVERSRSVVRGDPCVSELREADAQVDAAAFDEGRGRRRFTALTEHHGPDREHRGRRRERPLRRHRHPHRHLGVTGCLRRQTTPVPQHTEDGSLRRYAASAPGFSRRRKRASRATTSATGTAVSD
jgi:hypothetical protein